MNDKNPTIGIVGLGNFGLLMATVLRQDFKVKVYNYSKDQEIKSKAKNAGLDLVDWPKIYDCDIVIVSTPISITESIIKRLAPNLKKGTLLLDVCSVKVYPCQWLEKYAPKGVEIMGTHPMFGPTTANFNSLKKYWEIKDKQIVLCPVRITKTRQKKIVEFLKNLGLDVIITTPRDHDYQNAKTLSLVHFLGRSLTEAGVSVQKIYTPGYKDVLKILPHTNHDNWQLFYDLNNFNPYAQKMRRKFLKSCLKIEEKIIKSRSAGEKDFQRNLIEEIDNLLFGFLEKRMECSVEIGKTKKKAGEGIVDKNREEELVKKQSSRSKLNPKFIKNIYKLLFKESYKRQS